MGVNSQTLSIAGKYIYDSHFGNSTGGDFRSFEFSPFVLSGGR
jgi:hypothetical protein